jgi:hypothetical protein
MTIWERYGWKAPHHPTMPWWYLRRYEDEDDGVELYWLRTDGVRLHNNPVTDLAAFDDEHPLPPPPPAVGQVWAFAPNGRELSVDYVDATVENPVVRFANGAVLTAFPDMWPPEKQALVYGPGAPWAPSNWTDPTETTDGRSQ